MTQRQLILLSLILLIAGVSNAQHSYPFRGLENNEDIIAYWYNIPEDSIQFTLNENPFYFYSTLQIYGKEPGDDFKVRAEVWLRDSRKVYDDVFNVEKEAKDRKFTLSMKNGFFRIVTRVPYLQENPDRINITITAPDNERKKEIKFRYHTLYGKVTDFDGNPFKAIVRVCPDDFSINNTVWTDEDGMFEFELPERTYNSIFVDDESYKMTTLEAFGWNIIHDRDQRIDFKVGTGEVYNLNVWPNNGGAANLFISFRPMSLLENDAYQISINNKKFEIINIIPDLNPEDVSIFVNENKANILSMQKYYETGPDFGLPAYLIQVSRTESEMPGKQTIVVEFNKEAQRNGKALSCKGMGVCQFYTNYLGLSRYQ